MMGPGIEKSVSAETEESSSGKAPRSCQFDVPGSTVLSGGCRTGVNPQDQWPVKSLFHNTGRFLVDSDSKQTFKSTRAVASKQWYYLPRNLIRSPAFHRISARPKPKVVNPRRRPLKPRSIPWGPGRPNREGSAEVPNQYTALNGDVLYNKIMELSGKPDVSEIQIIPETAPVDELTQAERIVCSQLKKFLKSQMFRCEKVITSRTLRKMEFNNGRAIESVERVFYKTKGRSRYRRHRYLRKRPHWTKYAAPSEELYEEFSLSSIQDNQDPQSPEPTVVKKRTYTPIRGKSSSYIKKGGLKNEEPSSSGYDRRSRFHLQRNVPSKPIVPRRLWTRRVHRVALGANNKAKETNSEPKEGQRIVVSKSPSGIVIIIKMPDTDNVRVVTGEDVKTESDGLDRTCEFAIFENSGMDKPVIAVEKNKVSGSTVLFVRSKVRVNDNSQQSEERPEPKPAVSEESTEKEASSCNLRECLILLQLFRALYEECSRPLCSSNLRFQRHRKRKPLNRNK